MHELLRQNMANGVAVIAHTTRADGDLSPSTVPESDLQERRSQVVDVPWFVLRQVHSDRVVRVDQAKAPADRPVGDALITQRPGIALAVHAGDCVPVGFLSESGTIGVAHAGWKGLEGGVLESTVRQLGSGEATAVVGPHIRTQHYEFGRRDLNRLVARFGPHIEGETTDNTPALDLTAAIAGELDRLGVQVVTWSTGCTAGDEANYWSHRARKELGRIALVGWIEDAT